MNNRTVEIKNRYTGAVIFRMETTSLRLALEEAVRCNKGMRNADLRTFGGESLRGANLHHGDFRGANFGDTADLRGADLRDTCFAYAHLQYADLRDVDCREANFYDADLRHADCREMSADGACFRGTNFRGADLRGVTYLIHADVVDADFRRCLRD